VDRTGDPAAKRDGHPPDPASDRPTADPCAVQYFDSDALIEAELAQPACFGRGKLTPVDIGNGGRLTLRELFEAERVRHDRQLG
jgi:hypothetical protein